MLNADFKIDGSGFAALPERVGSAAGGSQAGFSGLYRQLSSEVSRFIEQGSTAAGGQRAAAAATAGATLSPEGAWRQLQGATAGGTSAGVSSASQQAFINEVLPLAQDAAARLGVAPELLAAQAALESGWGAKPIRREDGSSSHNLFGLKAGASWRGEVAEVTTTEYSQGQPELRREGFRSYASAREAFGDFAQLLLNNPRYRDALQTGSNAQAYAQALQKGGYATDPAYADKLVRVAAQIRGAL